MIALLLGIIAGVVLTVLLSAVVHLMTKKKPDEEAVRNAGRYDNIFQALVKMSSDNYKEHRDILANAQAVGDMLDDLAKKLVVVKPETPAPVAEVIPTKQQKRHENAKKAINELEYFRDTFATGVEKDAFDSVIKNVKVKYDLL